MQISMIHPDASQKVLESYSFKFAYSGITVERFDYLNIV
jgi:hypothetical protein